MRENPSDGFRQKQLWLKEMLARNRGHPVLHRIGGKAGDLRLEHLLGGAGRQVRAQRLDADPVRRAVLARHVPLAGAVVADQQSRLYDTILQQGVGFFSQWGSSNLLARVT